jgi:hypothetical protein
VDAGRNGAEREGAGAQTPPPRALSSWAVEDLNL